MIKDLISIVIPVYNAEAFLENTVQTIQAQTYPNWEALFVDDKSSDQSVPFLLKASEQDARIKVIVKEQNEGPALTRNRGILEANGEFVCFLDADDLWHPKKLETQIRFMRENRCAFSYTGYEFADKNGVPNGKKVYVPTKLTYRQALKNTTIFTTSVMFDRKQLDTNDICMPNVEAEDTATWWKVLKKTGYALGINQILSFYRRTGGSVSANKVKAAARTWNLYRRCEKFNIPKSAYYFAHYAFHAVKRRI